MWSCCAGSGAVCSCAVVLDETGAAWEERLRAAVRPLKRAFAVVCVPYCVERVDAGGDNKN